MALKPHLNELNYILMDLWEINIQVEDEYEMMILLAFFPSSYGNLVNTLSKRYTNTKIVIHIIEFMSNV